MIYSRRNLYKDCGIIHCIFQSDSNHYCQRLVKVSVNENFSTLLDFGFCLDFWHEWVLNFILAEKENQKVLSNSSKMSLFLFPTISCARNVIDSPCLLRDKTLRCRISRARAGVAR